MTAAADTPHPNNAAGRLHRVVLRVKEVGQTNTTMRQVWARAFSLDGDILVVLDALRLVSEDVDRLESFMESQGRPLDSYRRHASALRSLLAMDSLAQPWDSRKQHASELLEQALQLISFSMPEDHRTIPADELGRVIDAVAELRSIAANEEIPEEVRRFLNALADIAEKAVSFYPFVGRSAFRQAAAEVTSRWLEEPDVTREVSKMGKAAAAWDRAWQLILVWSQRGRDSEWILEKGAEMLGRLISPGDG